MAKKKSDAIVTIRGDLKQRHVRELELEALRVGHDYLTQRASSGFHEAMLKAAIGAGWIEEPFCEKQERREGRERVVEYYFDGELVDDLDPRVCYAAGDTIVTLMADFTRVDPTLSTPQQTEEPA
ncbi:MAG: hypothetical protein ACOC9X_01290 [bacterium]